MRFRNMQNSQVIIGYVILSITFVMKDITDLDKIELFVEFSNVINSQMHSKYIYIYFYFLADLDPTFDLFYSEKIEFYCAQVIRRFITLPPILPNQYTYLRVICCAVNKFVYSIYARCAVIASSIVSKCHAIKLSTEMYLVYDIIKVTL